MAKKQVALWLEESTHQALSDLARVRHRKISELAEEIIRDSVQMVAEGRLDGPALPAVRQVVDDAFKPHVERLAALIAKTHLEAGIAERLAFVLVAQAFGAEKAPQYLDAARTKAIEALKRPLGEQRPKE